MIIGGQVLTDDEWEALGHWDSDPTFITPHKRKFLEDALAMNGPDAGLPIPLQGTDRAIRKILVGEFDLISETHLTRCLMSEFENSFAIDTDDPKMVDGIEDATDRENFIAAAHVRLANAGALWSLASALLLIPRYFEAKVELVEKVKAPRRPSGMKTGLQSGGFSYVASIAPNQPVTSDRILSYAPRALLLDSSGSWSLLSKGSIGRGPHGEPVIGKTWISRAVEWRENLETPRTIYVKSTLSEARVKKAAIEAAQAVPASQAGNSTPTLYVLRCAAMAGMYKVGWTTGTAEDRAKELSAATGVPLSFIVVKYWTHIDAREIEAGVHAALAPYRINDAREFFQVDLATIEAAADAEIERVGRSAR